MLCGEHHSAHHIDGQAEAEQYQEHHDRPGEPRVKISAAIEFTDCKGRHDRLSDRGPGGQGGGNYKAEDETLKLHAGRVSAIIGRFAENVIGLGCQPREDGENEAGRKVVRFVDEMSVIRKKGECKYASQKPSAQRDIGSPTGSEIPLGEPMRRVNLSRTSIPETIAMRAARASGPQKAACANPHGAVLHLESGNTFKDGRGKVPVG